MELVLTLGKSIDDSLLLTKGAFFMATGGNWAFVLNEGNIKAQKRQYYQILTWI